MPQAERITHFFEQGNEFGGLDTPERNGASEGDRLRQGDEDDSDDDDGWPENKGMHPRRWSPEEDQRLRASVEKHQGTNWKEIAGDVGTRNHVQCLQRWKKVLTPGLVKGQWSREEDQVLTKLVKEGHKNWGALAARIPGRTSKQCRERWCHHLDPRIVKGDWTPEEDRIIVDMQQEIGNKWATIAQHLDGRTENATKIRWKILERSITNGQHEHKRSKQPLARSSFSRQGTDARMRCLAAQAAASAMSKANQAAGTVGVPEDPAKVQDVLEQSLGAVRGDDEEVDLSRTLPFEKPAASSRAALAPAATASRDGFAANRPKGKSSSRDTASLGAAASSPGRIGKKRKAPGGSRRVSLPAAVSVSEANGRRVGNERHAGRRGWLPEEDDRLRQAVEKYGERNWRYVAQSVSTRTHIQCQQRWKKALRPGLVKGAWSLEEDENLVTLIGQGFTNWSELAAHTPGRTAKQCRERWCHHLDPSVNHGSWAEEEDQLLCSLEARLGTKWAAIAREMPGRTEHAVKGRFKTLTRERRVSVNGVTSSSKTERGASKGAGQGGPKKKGRTDSRDPIGLAGQGSSPRALNGPPVFGQQASNGKAPRGFKESQPPHLQGHSPLSANGGASKRAKVAVALQGGRRTHDTVEVQEEHQQHQQQQRRHQQHKQQQQQQQRQLMQADQHQLSSQQLTQLQLSQFSQPGPAATAAAAAAAAVAPSAASAASAAVAPSDKILQHGPGTDNRSQAKIDNGVSIARLLSVSSLSVDSSLPEMASGVLSFDGVNDAKAAQLSQVAPMDGRSFVQPQPTHMSRTMGQAVPPEQASSPLQQEEAWMADHPTGMLPQFSAPDDSQLLVPMAQYKDLPAAVRSSTNTGPASTVSEASSLVSKPSQVDYSDLASILMDGFNANQDGVEAGGEVVTLGEDPYSDYSLSATPFIMQYHPRGKRVGTPSSSGGPSAMRESTSFNDFEGMRGASPDFTEVLATGVFDGGDPCDPYF